MKSMQETKKRIISLISDAIHLKKITPIIEERVEIALRLHTLTSSKMVFKESFVKGLLSQYTQEKISFGKMVELLNEKIVNHESNIADGLPQLKTDFFDPQHDAEYWNDIYKNISQILYKGGKARHVVEYLYLHKGDKRFSMEDVRNKLGPFKNLIALLKEAAPLYNPDIRIQDLIEKELGQCQINMQYLQSLIHKEQGSLG